MKRNVTQEKFNAKMFVGTDFRKLDKRIPVIGAAAMPFSAAAFVFALLFGTGTIANETPVPLMLIFFFVASMPFAFGLAMILHYVKAYKKAKYVFYHSEEVLVTPLDIIKTDFDSPPKGSVYGLTYAFLTRPSLIFIDEYRVRCAEDDDDDGITNVVNRSNEILLKDIDFAGAYRYEKYKYVRYTACYPFFKERDVKKLAEASCFRIKIDVENGVALYYKPEYAGIDVTNN